VELGLLGLGEHIEAQAQIGGITQRSEAPRRRLGGQTERDEERAKR
jgi:hypothetical protein